MTYRNQKERVYSQEVSAKVLKALGKSQPKHSPTICASKYTQHRWGEWKSVDYTDVLYGPEGYNADKEMPSSRRNLGTYRRCIRCGATQPYKRKAGRNEY